MPADDTREDVPLTWLARRPAFSAAAALVAGIALHPVTPDLPRTWLALAAAAALTAILLLRLAPRSSTAALITALAALGLAVAQLEKYRFPADHVIAYTTETPRLAEIELKIDQPPRTLTGDPTPGSRPLPPRQVTSGTVTRIKTWDGWQPATGEILLQVNPPNPDLACGQRVTALGLLARPA